MCILAHLRYYNKMRENRWLTNNKNSLLIVPKSGKSKIKLSADLVFSESYFLVYTECLLVFFPSRRGMSYVWPSIIRLSN